jgi:prophage maintenance system killer protein
MSVRSGRRICLGQLVVAAGGVGMSASGVPSALAKLCDHLNQSLAKAASWSFPPPKKMLAVANLLASAAVSFLKIHPFLDGNSRMARLLLLVLTLRLELPGILTVVPPVEPEFSALKKAAMRGETRPWIAYIVRVLASSP